MSRSRKKTLGFADRNPYMKTYFNRCVRRRNKVAVHKDHENYDYIPSGKAYTKANCSYDICDYTWLFYSDTALTQFLEKNSHWLTGRYRYVSK